MRGASVHERTFAVIDFRQHRLREPPRGHTIDEVHMLATIEQHRKKHPEIRADFTIDQHWSRYTAEDHGIWKTLYRRMEKILPGRACDEFLSGMKRLEIGAERIPNFEELSERLHKLTGWRVVA